MKKYITALLTVIVALLFCLPALADNMQQYRCDDPDISISFADEYDVFNYDFSVHEADDVFSKSDDEVKNYYKDNGILFEALSPDRNIDITVAKGWPLDDISDLKGLSDAELNETALDIYKTVASSDYVKNNNILCEYPTIQKTDGCVYICMSYITSELRGVKYYTVDKNVALTLSMYVYAESSDGAENDVLSDSAASLTVNSAPLGRRDALIASLGATVGTVGIVFFTMTVIFVIMSVRDKRRRLKRVQIAEDSIK